MLNHSFSTTARSEKIKKLKKALKSKAPKLTPEHINTIINHIDVEKQHHIKFTKNISKFENIVTDEYISTESMHMESHSVYLYGDFKVGLYKNENGLVVHHKTVANSSLPAAAIKIIKEKKVSTTKTTMMIIIYQP